MQPERSDGRKSGAQSCGWLSFPLKTGMDTLRLQKVENELRTASQSLWDFRTKDQAEPGVAMLLDSAQDSLSDLLQHLAACREFLDGQEPS